MRRKTAFLLALIFTGLILIPTSTATSQPSDLQTLDKQKMVEQVKDLEAEIDSIEKYYQAIQARLEVTQIELLSTYNQLEEAEQELAAKEEILNQRLRGVYREGKINILQVLLNTKNFSDFLTRLSFLGQVGQADARLVKSLQKQQALVKETKQLLDEKKQEQLTLRQQQKAKLALLETKRKEKKRALEKLTQEQQILLAQEREQLRLELARRRASSIPLCVRIRWVKARVYPYLKSTYITSEYMPRSFSTSGLTFYGEASWYGGKFNGQPTASGEIYNENDFTCASPTLPFDTYLAVSYGGRHVVVKVNDRGPFVKGRILDLSKAAAQALGLGVGYVRIEIVRPNQ